MGPQPSLQNTDWEAQLSEYDKLLARNAQWGSLLEAVKAGDPKQSVEALLLLSKIFGNNWEHELMPPEFIQIFAHVANLGLSLGDLQQYLVQSPESEDQELSARIQAFLAGHRVVKMSSVSEVRPMVSRHAPYNPHQPIPVAWANEIAVERSVLRAATISLLERIDAESGITEYVNSLLSHFLEGDSQIVPDSVNSKLLASVGSRLEAPLAQRLLDKGTLNSPESLGVPRGRAADGILRQIASMKAAKAESLHRLFFNWQKANPGEKVTPERIQRMREISDIILGSIGSETGPNDQISEMTLEWLTLYGLEATREGHQVEGTAKEQFAFTLSLGGDQVPPPYVETYVVEPLEKLAALQAQMEAGTIKSIPTFEIIGTAFSQLAENSRDHEGNDIVRDRHIYNSLVTMARIRDFIATYYPTLMPHVHFHLFPEYQVDGPYRIYLAALANRLPEAQRKNMLQMFSIKGDVADDTNDTDDKNREESDPAKLVFGTSGNLVYPARHLHSNGLASSVNTLRFGAYRTEAPFHLFAGSVAEHAGDPTLMAEIQTAIESSSLNGTGHRILERRGEISAQISRYQQQRRGISAQLGMNGVYATYYQQRFDRPLALVAEDGHLAPREDALPDQPKKLAAVFQTLNRLDISLKRIESGESPRQKLMGHLRKWAPRYSSNGHSPSGNPEDLAATLGLNLVPEAGTREFLNLHLS